jgi:hypothetical protein
MKDPFLAFPPTSRAAKQNPAAALLLPLPTMPRPTGCCVPPELLPLKKRVVRYHPYAAAWAIQELSLSTSPSHAEATRRRRREEEDDDDAGLRAELLRLRISRPALVLTKPLSCSDRSRDRARLVLPEKLVLASPLPDMLTPAERRFVFGPGLPVPAFDRRGRAYRMTLRRDPAARAYLLGGQWTRYLSRHDARGGDAIELLAFRPSAWQTRLDKHGEGGLGMALLHCPDTCWTRRERDAAEGLLLIAAPTASSCTCRLLTSANGLDTSSRPIPIWSK